MQTSRGKIIRIKCFLGLHQYATNPRDGSSVFVMLGCENYPAKTIEQNFAPPKQGVDKKGAK